jgi:putative aldouronate transport system permease protein
MTAGDYLMYLVILAVSFICLFPLALVIIVSITDESTISRFGYMLVPHKLSLEAYRLILHGGSSVLRSYAISITITTIGTVTAVLITILAGFAIANRRVRFRNAIALFFYVTILFNAGIVPWYMVCVRLGLRNNLLSLIVPSLLFSPFNLFLVRNYMRGIPDSLIESARMDGANDAIIALRVYFPLCIPVVAVIALFYALAYWNDWWNAIMLMENQALYPLQYLLFRLQSELSMIRILQELSSVTVSATAPSESVKMATVVVTIGPIVLLYPFLQRYFVKGLVIGAIKG